MKWTVDRIEGDIAVCETESGFVNVSLSALPQGTGEGTVIALEIDENEAQSRKKRIEGLMNGLFTD